MNYEVNSPEAPVVEIDSRNRAAYIRFKRTKIVRTFSPGTSGVVIAVDLDRNNEVVGVELIGVREFSLTVLLRKLPFIKVKAPIERTRYIATRTARFNPEQQVA